MSEPDWLPSKHVLEGALQKCYQTRCPVSCAGHMYASVESDRPAGDRKSPPDQALMH